ncbi:inositol monophosphatase family protein [Phormidium sp. CLA17]|uniref:3'(2'),5'-bisphosphate nucleotidase CysQ family protein n=1 Tax=Leptolyngbya sp. Cla-17 TaxID=2803751 RepID=UPI001490A258|nr:inositol monophosphatase family protein [Leptolyngbya sp. Cla-17]MBM0743214.1 inositol monophosphatase family protein [Leptolyngbya sp. Cla-17]
MNPISLELDRQIRDTIRHCGLQIIQMASEEFEIFEKGPEDYVTTIDQALDAQLSTVFSHLFPNDGVITEEDIPSRQKFYQKYARLWCIDPLDGTEDFIEGRSNYSVMVGLLENYQPIAGWIYAPVHDQLYYGGVNWGLFQTSADGSPRPLASAPQIFSADLCRMMIGHRDQARYGNAIVHQIPNAEFYSMGSFGLKVLEVITGKAELYIYLNGRVKLWDTAGPLALAQAAGLICCTLEGEPIQFSPDAIEPNTFAHRQSIVIGWPDYVEALRPKLEMAVKMIAKK